MPETTHTPSDTQPEHRGSRPFGSRLACLLVPSTPYILALLVFAALCLASEPGRYLSFDTFLHVFVGEHMLRTGELVETDPGNWAVDRPYLDHEWLPQLILGAFYLGFGLEGLVLFTALMAGLVYGLIADWMRRRGAGPLVTATLLAGAFLALRMFTLARPFLFSWLLAVVWTRLLEKLIRGQLPPLRWLAMATPLMWLWANLHAGFLLGFFLLGLFGLAQLWRIAAASRAERRRELRLFLWMVGGGQLALFASALNLYGFRLHAHFLVYLSQTGMISRIAEWQAPYFHSANFLPVLLLFGFFLLVWLASPRRLTAAELVLVLALLLAALKAQRNLPFFVLLTLPVAGARLEELFAQVGKSGSWLGRPVHWLRDLSQWAARGENRRQGLLTAAVLVTAVVAAVGVRKVNPVALDERRLPLAAARFVTERPELFGGEMYNFYNWGGYLAWKLQPTQVFINGLQDHYGAAHYRDYTTVAAVKPTWQEILDSYGVDWIIYPAQSPLTGALDLHPGWRRVYRDRMAEIFVRAASTTDAAGETPVPAWAMRQASELPNVLVLVLDTLRADAVGAYGAGPARTPALDRLAAEGTLFTRARSTSAWTLPAHGSLFTGLYPSRHGAHWEHRVLGWERLTLAELLAPTHATAGFSENPHITRAQGFARGFEAFEETWRVEADIPLDTLERIASWLEGRDASRPFFLFANLMTPHLPYRPPPGTAADFLPAGAEESEVERLRGFTEREARRFMSGARELNPHELEILRALYRADVAHADAQVSRLLEMLAGELDDTLVVVVGDHGENIGDHGLMEHQLCLYETLLRVPMILRLPGVVEAGHRDQAPVQLVDVLPTVLDAVGVPHDRRPAIEGRSLLRHELPAERPVYAEYMRPTEQKRLFGEVSPEFDFEPYDRRLKSIQIGDMKLIVPERGAVELYDLAQDPGETRDLAAARPRIVEALRRRLEVWSGGWRPAANGESQPILDEETRKALRSLGYLD